MTALLSHIAPPPPVVELDALRHCFGATVALHDITTRIQPNLITGLVGPDAAGKTTLLRLIAGLLRPTAGHVRVFGHNMATNAAAAHPSIGYMPQRFGLYEDLGVGENLQLFADLHGMPPALRAERIARLLQFTGLTAFTARLAGQLSGGMKQKLGLACALLSRPRLLLLDEPSVGVDPASRRELWAIVNAMLAEGRDDGMAVIWATAYLDEAERCGRVMLLHQGELLVDAPPADFLRPLQGRVFRMTLPGGQRRAIARQAAQVPAVLDAQVAGDTLRLVLREGMPPPEPRALGGTSLESLPPRFEDGFIARLAADTPLSAAATHPSAPIPPPRLAGGGWREAPNGPSRQSNGSHSPAPALPKSPTAGEGVPPSRSVASLASWPPAPPPSVTSPPIIVHDLVRRFGSFVAVDHISFSVQRGEIFGLLGPNGAGNPRRSACCAACCVLPPEPPASPARTCCTPPPKRARASATWRSASRSMPN